MKDVMTKDRTLKWWYVGVIVLIICGAGLFIYQSFSKKDDKNATPTATATPSPTATATPSQPVALDVTSEEVTKLINTLDHGLSMYCGNWLYFTDRKFEAKDFKNDDVYQIAVLDMNVYSIRSDNEVPGRNFTKAQLDEKIDAIFGKDYEFTHQTYNSTCPFWSYNSSSQVYEYQGDGCGGTCGPTNLKKIVKAIKDDSNIEIYIRVIFADSNYDSVTYYKDYQKTVKLSGLDLDANGGARQTDQNFANSTLYKVVFKNEDGNYVFVSSEPVES